MKDDFDLIVHKFDTDEMLLEFTPSWTHILVVGI